MGAPVVFVWDVSSRLARTMPQLAGASTPSLAFVVHVGSVARPARARSSSSMYSRAPSSRHRQEAFCTIVNSGKTGNGAPLTPCPQHELNRIECLTMVGAAPMTNA